MGDDSWERALSSLSSPPTRAELVDYLDGLPPRDERSWELALTALIERRPDSHGTLLDIADSEEIEGIEDTYAVQFGALFAHCTYHRRHRNVSELERRLARFPEFEGEPMFAHLRSLFLQLRGGSGDLSQAVEEATRAARELEDQQGVEHNMALATITAVEGSGDLDRPDERLEEAEENVRSALEKSDYPRFYATYGRILAAKGMYEPAERNIRRAIDKESEDKSDYAMRIGNYQRHLNRIELQRHADDLERRLEGTISRIEEAESEARERFTDMQTRMLQFVGFFATLLAVIIGSVQIATSFGVVDAMALILTLVGGLLLAYGGLGFLLPRVDRRNIAGVALFGLLSVAAGVGLLAVFG